MPLLSLRLEVDDAQAKGEMQCRLSLFIGVEKLFNVIGRHFPLRHSAALPIRVISWRSKRKLTDLIGLTLKGRGFKDLIWNKAIITFCLPPSPTYR
jgi:hypothetical protein